VVDVTHEALIRGWPELRGWINDDREQLRLHRRLSDAATDWDAGGRDEGQLYRGAPLAVWEGRDESDLNELERGFLAASRERVERERASRRKRTRVTIGALAGVAAVIAGIAVFAFIQRNDASDQRDLATSRQLAGSSTLARQRDPELATLLAESGYAAAPTVEAEEALRQGVHESSIRAALTTPDELAAAAAPAGSGRLVVAGESGGLRLWDAEGDPRGTSPALVGTSDTGIDALTATPAGYVTGDGDGAVVLWPGRAAPGAPRRVASLPGAVIDLHTLPGGDRVIVASTAGAFAVGLSDGRVRRVATGSFADAVVDPTSGGYITAGDDGTVQLWNNGSPSPLEIGGYASALEVSPDGSLLAVGTDEGVDVVRLGPQPAVAFSRPVEAGGNEIAFSPDGARFAVAGGGGSVLVYSRAGRLLSELRGHEGSVVGVGFPAPDTVVSVGTDGATRVWGVTAASELRGYTLPFVGGVTFDESGRVTLVDADGAVGSWDPGRPSVRPLAPAAAPENVYSSAAAGGLTAIGLLDGGVIVRDRGGAELASLSFPDEAAAGVALDPRGRRAAVALTGGSGRVEVIDLAAAATSRTVGRHSDAAFAVAFSPVDETIASGGRDGTVKTWEGPAGPQTLGAHDGQVTTVAFSPSGRWLATGSGDKTVRIWDLSGQEEPRVIRTHQDLVVSVAFAGDDRVVSGGLDAVRVTDWRRGVTLLTVPRPAQRVTTFGDAPRIAYYGADNVVRVIECDVCGPIDTVETAAQERTTRELTEAEQADFHVDS
jgi:WD40 repeat protein